MAGNPRRDSRAPDTGTGFGSGGFLRRWSERKQACTTSALPPADTRSGERQVAPGDEDMPPLESLDADSDYSGFLSPGVSDRLHRLALRKLFLGAEFQVCDGLDDYDRDYHQLQPLRGLLAGTADMLSSRTRSAPEVSSLAEEEPAGSVRDEEAPPQARRDGLASEPVPEESS